MTSSGTLGRPAGPLRVAEAIAEGDFRSSPAREALRRFHKHVSPAVERLQELVGDTFDWEL